MSSISALALLPGVSLHTEEPRLERSLAAVAWRFTGLGRDTPPAILACASSWSSIGSVDAEEGLVELAGRAAELPLVPAALSSAWRARVALAGAAALWLGAAGGA